MFVGSMALAHAMEHVHLHRRLALLVLRYVGSSIIWYVLFFFLISKDFSRRFEQEYGWIDGSDCFFEYVDQ